MHLSRSCSRQQSSTCCSAFANSFWTSSQPPIFKDCNQQPSYPGLTTLLVATSKRSVSPDSLRFFISLKSATWSVYILQYAPKNRKLVNWCHCVQHIIATCFCASQQNRNTFNRRWYRAQKHSPMPWQTNKESLRKGPLHCSPPKTNQRPIPRAT